MTTLFISDLHLSPERPEKLALFSKLMRGPARNAEALYILGDLVERFWVGVDNDAPLNTEIISTLADYTQQGNRNLFVMCGNRDFYLDRHFESMTGCCLIPDPTVIHLNGRKTMLMHGDTLCTNDVHYLQWRRFITHPAIRKTFFALPLTLRRMIAHGVRGVTRHAASMKPPGIIDVSQDSVAQVMQEYGVQELIHGHTHRQAIHEFMINATPARRIVLGDWYIDDCVLVCDETGLHMMGVKKFIDSH